MTIFFTFCVDFGAVWKFILMVCLVSVEGDLTANHNGYDYKFFMSLASWNDSLNECIKWNASLASIKNSDESEFIIRNVRSTDNPFWIGLHSNTICDACRDTTTENSLCSNNRENECCNCRNNWRWIDDKSRPIEFSNWHPREPTGGNFCGQLKYDANLGWNWYDFRCSEQKSYICKKASDGVSHDQAPPASSGNGSDITPKRTERKPGDDSFIGIGVGVMLFILVVIAVVVIVIVWRKRLQKTNVEKNCSEDQTYYNEVILNQSYADGQNGVSHKKYECDNQKGNVLHDSSEINNQPNEDNTSSYPSQDGYAEIIISHVRPQLLAPKPMVTKELQYADIEFDNNKNVIGNGEQEGLEYSSVDSIKRPTQIYFNPNNNGNAVRSYGTDVDYKNTSDSSYISTESSRLSEDQLSAMYAQPVKNKGLKSNAAKVEHVPAPQNEQVLYAVPTKNK